MSGFRPVRASTNRRETYRGDSGMTLVELLVAMGVFMILIAITFPVLNTFFSVDTGVAQTVTAVNQLLPATTTLERYLRSAVQPAPPVVSTPGLPGTPVPLFAPVTGSSPTTYQMGPSAFAFYSNVGDANGPELVNASVSGPNGKGLYTLTVTATRADPNTCPGTGASMSSSAHAACTYTTNPAKPIAVINLVTNGAATSSTPIFQYSIVSNASGVPTFVGPTVPPTWQCTSSTACNPATLTAMQITINTKSTIGGLASLKTIVYFQAPTYSAGVG